MKKILALAVALVLMVSIVALVACNNNTPNNNEQTVQSAKNFYAYGAVSIATMIDTVSTTPKAQSNQPLRVSNQNGANGTDNTLSGSLTDEQLQTVNDLMGLAESIMGEGNVTSSVTESDREGYKYKSVVSFVDMLGNKVEYTLYYNETLIGGNQTQQPGGNTDGSGNGSTTNPDANTNEGNGSTTNPDGQTGGDQTTTPEGNTTEQPTTGKANLSARDRDDDDDDRYDDENEQTARYEIDGIMIVNEQEFAIKGYSKLENETDYNETETSTEMYFVAYTSADQANYIKVEQADESETEGNQTETEKEVVFSVYTNNKLTERTTIEQEQETNEKELTMIVYKDGVTSTLKFEDETKGNVRKIDVQANMEGQNVHFKIWITTNEQGEDVYRYEFKDGFKDMDRHHWDD